MASSASICVAGAGSIGCFVGGMLRVGGRPVSLLARPRVIDDINRQGLKVTSFEGSQHRLTPAEIKLSDDPAIFAEARIILVTVKSDDTAEIADLIARYAAKDAVIISLQNGTGNVAVLREALPDHDVLAGMVPFNVVSMGEGHFHRATSATSCWKRMTPTRQSGFGCRNWRSVRWTTSPACSGASCWSI